MSKSVESILAARKANEQKQDKDNKDILRHTKEKNEANRKILDKWFQSLCKNIIDNQEKWKDTYNLILEKATEPHTVNCDVLSYDENTTNHIFPPVENLSIDDTIEAMKQGYYLQYYVKQKNHQLNKVMFQLIFKYDVCLHQQNGNIVLLACFNGPEPFSFCTIL